MRKIAEQLCLFLSYLIFFSMRFVRLLIYRKPSNGKCHVLVLSNDVLGDAISRVPFFAALRRDMPRNSHYITVLVRDSHKSIYESMPYFDEVVSVHITFDRHPILWLFHKDMNWAVDRKAEVLISCLKEESLWQQFVRHLFRCNIMVGPGVGLVRPRIVNKGSCKYLALPRIGKSLVADFDFILNFLTQDSLGIERVDPKELQFLTSPVDALIPAGSFMAVVPGAGIHYRQWPIDRFIYVIEKTISQFPEMEIVVLGSSSEFRLGEQIQKALPEKTHNLCGMTSFGELGGVLHKARVVLTNETGSATFAAVLGVKTVCILGGGDFGTYFPNDNFYKNTVSIYNKEPCFGCVWRCTKSQLIGVAPCIDSISKEKVLKELIEKIKQS